MNDTRSAIRHLLGTAWFIPTVLACDLIIFTVGLIIGIKIGHG